MQYYRTFSRLPFFLLFMLAPPLDLFRFDLNANHLFFLGEPWRLGFTAQSDSMAMVGSIFLRIFMPLFLVVGVGGWISWKYGRLYCGWLCPHFAVVEIINSLMRRASGKPSLWEKQRLPEQQADGKHIPRNPWYWPVTGVGFDSPRAKLCSDCDASCEHACPMRLKPRTIKRNMFTCTQCHSCIDACGKVQEHASGVSLLQWVNGECAKAVAKDAGVAANPPANCFQHGKEKSL